MINRKEIERLIAMELEEANKVHPLFASDHEAYAVIKEEIEETEKEAESVRSFLKTLWWSIKHDRDDTAKQYKLMKEAAIRQIQEAIQIAAMCDKALKSK